MELKIYSISFSNFLSYGSSPTTIDFTSGLTLIQGANGTGKSSALLDVMSFCLYGKPYRRIKIEEILNRKNKGNLKTSCTFSVGSDEYKLTRNKAPDKLELLKNGNEVDLLSSKKLTQVEIDKILGVSYEIFKQIIAISVNYNKPFLTLDSASKRKTIEQMFGISEFCKLNKVLQEKYKSSKKLYDVLENSCMNAESTIKLLNRQIISLEEQNRNFKTQNELKITKHLQEISREQVFLDDSVNELEPLKPIVEKLQAEIKKLDKSKYSVAKMKLEKQKSEHEWNVRNLGSQISKLKTETNCPTCKKPFDVEKRMTQIDEKEIAKKEAEQSIKEIDVKLEALLHNIEVIEKKESSLTVKLGDSQRIQSDIKDRQRNIRVHQEAITELKNSKNTIDIDKVRAEVKEKEIELESNKVKRQSEFKRIKNFELVEKILGDDGVKSYIISKVYPLLNRKIQEYVELFELPIKISFNSVMDEKIISLENFRMETSYYSYSEGEKARINIAIMLSLLDTMKVVSNWRSNLLVVDELFDGATDINGLEQIITAMKKMSQDKSMCISIISHRMNENFSEHFDSRMIVKKGINGFSQIELEK